MRKWRVQACCHMPFMHTFTALKGFTQTTEITIKHDVETA